MNKRKLIRSLQEASSLVQSDNILNSLHASPLQRKAVEMGILQKLSNTPAGVEYGRNLIHSVVKELENDNGLKPSEEPAVPESPGLKTKGDHFVKEELLENGDTGSANTDSEQSSDNTEPYPQVGKMEGDEDMENAPDTENQMKEGMMPPQGMPGMMPPQQQMGGMPGMIPQPPQQQMGGMDPNIAGQMGSKMPQLPPMSTPQQMQQMQYTIRQYHNQFVSPLLKEIQNLKNVARAQSKLLKETMARSGGISLDMDTLRKHASARVMQETTTPMVGNPLVINKEFDTQTARANMLQLNKQLAEQSR